ncbi:MAG: hydrogenase maturation nickel metallochaperone HypA [Mycobacterium sp.]|nr:hydrogenase maturation nickel metallochaperone HypA [Mycobacterium sp.]
MHELAITENIVDTIADRLDGVQVKVVRLEIGQLSGVVAESVRFCFDVVAQGTALADATLYIVEPPGRVHCRSCGNDSELEDAIPLCPCGSADVDLLSGYELRIQSVEVV